MKREFLRSDDVGGYPITLSYKDKIFAVSFRLPAVGDDRRDFTTRGEAETFYDKMLRSMKGEPVTDYEYITQELSKITGVPVDRMYINWDDAEETWTVQIYDPKMSRIEKIYVMWVTSDDSQYDFACFKRDDNAAVVIPLPPFTGE